MAAHSGTPAIPPVAPDQPPTGWPQWLRDMAQSINLISARLGAVDGVPFDQLPVDAGVGTLTVCTDSNTATWGAVIAGGGSNVVLAARGATGWTVVGHLL